VLFRSSDVPENREVVEDVGFTFKRGDVDDLERMLRLLMENSQLRQAAAQSARRRVKEKYLWKQIAEQISQTYERVVRPAKSVPPVISSAKLNSRRNSRAA